MGSVDLVVLVESPGSVARGLQRIGRAGHQVGEPSTGKIFPKYRGDLLEASVVAERMRAAPRGMRYPRNPLDVLAQQIVACARSTSGMSTSCAPLIRRTANFRGSVGRCFRRRARHARRPLSVRSGSQSCGRGWCGIVMQILGVRGTGADGSRSERRHDPRSWLVRRVPP